MRKRIYESQSTLGTSLQYDVCVRMYLRLSRNAMPIRFVRFIAIIHLGVALSDFTPIERREAPQTTMALVRQPCLEISVSF